MRPGWHLRRVKSTTSGDGDHLLEAATQSSACSVAASRTAPAHTPTESAVHDLQLAHEGFVTSCKSISR